MKLAWVPRTLGAGGGGRLMLLYSTAATPDDVIEGFAVAWLAAEHSASALAGEREAAEAGLSAASRVWLPEWRREAGERIDEFLGIGD
jgi:hypothetical protein